MIRLRRSDPPQRQMISMKTSVDPVPIASIPPAASPPAVSAPVISSPAINPPKISPPAVKKVNVTEHPLAQHALMALRNKHTAPAQFRQISNQLLAMLALETTRTVPTRDDMVQTHSTTHTGPVLAKPVVFLSVARHGLGLAHQVAELLPELLVGSISLDRSGDSPGAEPRLHIVNSPALSDARVILFDPVVATGLSASQAINFIRRTGANDITLISFIVSFQGLTRLQTAAPDLTVWTAGIDSEWDSKRGPLPGLGNFAERLFG